MPAYNHECFIPIEPGTTVWRYLDLEKFKSLLETKSLFFCRADKFSDPFEGSIPRKETVSRITSVQIAGALSGQHFDNKQSLDAIREIQISHQKIKRSTIINCWHINNNESDAMWKLYLKDNEGVALQSSSNRLLAVIEEIPDVIGLSKVRYIDYDNDIWDHPEEYPCKFYNVNTPLVHKRKEFMHERELRLLCSVEPAFEDEDYWLKQPSKKGRLIRVSLELLIEKIYLPPTIENKTAIEIEQLSLSHGYHFNFLKSKLAHEPYY
jgi:hypothetical protein